MSSSFLLLEYTLFLLPFFFMFFNLNENTYFTFFLELFCILSVSIQYLHVLTDMWFFWTPLCITSSYCKPLPSRDSHATTTTTMNVTWLKWLRLCLRRRKHHNWTNLTSMFDSLMADLIMCHRPQWISHRLVSDSPFEQWTPCSGWTSNSLLYWTVLTRDMRRGLF